jgi:O-antigen ligase
MRLRSVVMAYAIGLATVAFFSYVALLTPFDLGATLVGEGLARQIFGIKRLVGTEENQNAFALYFTCGMPIALYACASSRSILGRLIWIVLFVGFLAGAMLTLSRGAMLGGLAAVAVWLAYRQPSQSLRLRIFAAAIALLGAAAWLLASSETFALLTSLDNAGIANVIEDKSFSTQTRVTMLQTLFDIYLDNPIVGIGYGHLPELVNEYIGQRLGAHNIFIGIGIELGVVALLAFCGVILFALSIARHAALLAGDAMTRDLAALLLAMLVGQMTNGLVHESYINFLLWLNIALIGALPLCCSTMMTPHSAPRR